MQFIRDAYYSTFWGVFMLLPPPRWRSIFESISKAPMFAENVVLLCSMNRRRMLLQLFFLSMYGTDLIFCKATVLRGRKKKKNPVQDYLLLFGYFVEGIGSPITA